MKLHVVKNQIEKIINRHNPERDAGDVTWADAALASALAEILEILDGAEITKSKPCPVCGGRGWKMHPAWEEYEQAAETPDAYEWFEEHHPEALTHDEKWWRKILPPVEIECPECQGEGVIRTKIVFGG